MNAPIGIIRLSALALACAASLSAQANPSNADYAKVVLYGDVTIAQDSTSSWGIWEQLEPPAAGVQAPLIALRTSGDLYRPLPVPPNPVPPVNPAIEGFCAGGSLCGFGVLADQGDLQPEKKVAGPLAVRVPTAPTQHAFQMFGVDLKSEGNSNSWLPNAMSLTIQMMSVGEAALNDVARMELQKDLRTHQFAVEDRQGERGISITTSVADEIEGVDVGAFNGKMYRYINGNSDPSAIDQRLIGFWGVTTSTVDMAALRQSQAAATYTGRGIDAMGYGTGNMVMVVDFGTSAFTMSANGGSDTKVLTLPTTAGTQLVGSVGYNVVGTLTGSTFESRQITAVDGTIGAGSSVKGAFLGAGAAVAIGASDIVKTKVGTEGSLGYTNARHVNTFALIKDGTVLNETKR